MQDKSIIRNRLKILAVINNAKVVCDLQKKHLSFHAWLESQGELSLADWTKLFKNNFKFTGGMIVHEFLMSTGFLPGAHDKDCELYSEILKSKPNWLKYEVSNN